MLTDKIASLALAQVDFIDDAVEGTFETALVAFGELYRKSLELDALSVDNAELETVATGVLELANQFGTVFGNLTNAQKDSVRAAVQSIVTGPNEVLVETFFDACLNFITAAKALNEAVDAINPPDPIDGE